MYLAISLLFTACGGGSASLGGTLPPPPPSNPVPAIVSLSPNSATSGGAAFTITVNGQNFISSSTVYWNSPNALATTYVSSTQLKAQVTAANIASAGLAAVSVGNPVPGGGNSGAAEFPVNPTSNPAPVLNSLNPSSVNAGASGVVLTLNGTNFLPESTIEWNGTAVPTAYLSDTQLEVQLPATSTAVPGYADLTVVNPAPGGGASAPLLFTIAYVPIVVNQLVNDLVWDSTHQLIYLSVPSYAGSNGNSISMLNPTTVVRP